MTPISGTPHSPEPASAGTPEPAAAPPGATPAVAGLPTPATATPAATRVAGYSALAGALVMLAGTALWGASGTDLDRALATGGMAGYLAAAAGNGLVVANLTAWIVGVLLLGAAGTAIAGVCTRRTTVARLAMYSYCTAVPLAIASFVAWLALVVQLAPGATAGDVTLAELVGWFASRADWTATVLGVGVGPALLARAGRGDWAPGWLVGWGAATAVAAALTVIAMFAGGLSTYGFLIVPVGLGWTIAAGVVLLLRAGAG